MRRAAIRWRRARAVQLAWHVWVGLVQRRGAEAAALSEGQAQARAWQAGRVVKRWRAWQLGRAGRREAGLAGERHWLVGWAERWRERAAARAVRRGEAQRLLAEAQQRRVRAGLFRWRAEADARGMRRAIATSKAAAGARAVQVLKLRRAMGRWVEWERRRAVKRIRGIRARARGQAALARAVWRAWVTYLLARRTVKQLARRTAAQRARARWRRGWRALARAVRQARHRMRRDAQALRAWKGARQRQGWAMWAVSGEWDSSPRPGMLWLDDIAHGLLLLLLVCGDHPPPTGVREAEAGEGGTGQGRARVEQAHAAQARSATHPHRQAAGLCPGIVTDWRRPCACLPGWLAVVLLLRLPAVAGDGGLAAMPAPGPSHALAGGAHREAVGRGGALCPALAGPGQEAEAGARGAGGHSGSRQGAAQAAASLASSRAQGGACRAMAAAEPRPPPPSWKEAGAAGCAGPGLGWGGGCEEQCCEACPPLESKPVG